MTQTLSIVWNPSEGIDLGFFMIRYYSLMFVIAFGLGWYIMKHIFVSEGETIEKLGELAIKQESLSEKSLEKNKPDCRLFSNCSHTLN